MVHSDDAASRAILFWRKDKVVVAKERTRIAIGVGIQTQGLLGGGVESGGGDAIAGKRRTQVFEILR